MSGHDVAQEAWGRRRPFSLDQFPTCSAAVIGNRPFLARHQPSATDTRQPRCLGRAASTKSEAPETSEGMTSRFCP